MAMTGIRIPAEMVTAEGLIQGRIAELKGQARGDGDGAGPFVDGEINGLTEALALLFRGAVETRSGA